MAKIFIFADDPKSEAVQNAVKMLSAAHSSITVSAEQLTPVNILAIATGLLSANAGEIVDAIPHVEDPADIPVADIDTSDNADIDSEIETALDVDAASSTKPVEDEDASSEDDTGTEDDEVKFNFESLGMVDVDGELIEAFTTAGEPTLFVKSLSESLSEGKKCSYKLNESVYSVWFSESAEVPKARVHVNHKLVLAVKVLESKRDTAYILLNNKLV